MATRVDFQLTAGQREDLSVTPISGREIQVTGPLTATLFTDASGFVRWNTPAEHPFSFPFGTYTFTLVMEPDEALTSLANPLAQGSPLNWFVNGATFDLTVNWQFAVPWPVDVYIDEVGSTACPAGINVTFGGTTLEALCSSPTAEAHAGPFYGFIGRSYTLDVDVGYTAVQADPFYYAAVSSLPASWVFPSTAQWNISLSLTGIDYGEPPGGPVGYLATTAPWCLQSPIGQYHETEYDAAGIKYHRANHPTPPFASLGKPGAAGDIEARMTLGGNAQLALLLTRVAASSPSVYRTESHDDGATWSTPTLMFTGCKHPTLNTHRLSQRTLYGAFKLGADARGTLRGALQEAHDGPLSAEFTLKLAGGGSLELDDDVFHFAPAVEGPTRWTLVGRDAAEIVRYYSTDDGRTWTLIP